MGTNAGAERGRQRRKSQKAKETGDVFWRDVWRNSKAAFERYKRTRREYGRRKKEELRNFEKKKNAEERANESIKLFRKIIRSVRLRHIFFLE